MDDQQNWTREACIQLAEELEYYPCLWDRSHPDYKKSVAKYDAKNQLARKLKVEYGPLDNKLKSITAQFHREFKKQNKTKSGQAAGDSSKSKWYLLPYLMYLQNTYTIRQTYYSQEPEDIYIAVDEVSVDNDSSQNRGEVASSQNRGVVTSSQNRDEVATSQNPGEVANDQETNDHGGMMVDILLDEEENERNWDDVQQSNTNGSEPQSHRYTVAKRPLKRKWHEPAANNESLSKAIVKLAESLGKIDDDSKTASTTDDEWSMFGNSVATKIRKLKNKVLQMKVEHEIHTLLFNAAVEDAGCTVSYIPSSRHKLLLRKRSLCES